MARVLIAVTHLLGSGHLVRAQHLARALATAGHAVTLASGGMPLKPVNETDFAFPQLPPAKVEGVDFRNLLDEAGRPIDAARRQARAEMLKTLAGEMRPDVVVTEHFPFGRRQLADEFLGLIAATRAANPAALVLSSIRDVLVAPRADRVAEAERRLAEHFDGVLVHGDRRLLALDASWPVSPELEKRLHYTGYITPAGSVANEAARRQNEGAEPAAGEILVSGGGSAAALPLFQLCLASARLLGRARRWRILVGRGTGQADFDTLRQAASAHVTVEWARPDFPALLADCALSISQAGYNTVLDLVAARRPAIVVPFDAGNETEQAIRAEAMAKGGLARCLRLGGDEALTPERLGREIAATLADGLPQGIAIDLDGARNAASIIGTLLAARRVSRA